MKTKSVHLIIGTVATACALPLAVFGFRSLFAEAPREPVVENVEPRRDSVQEPEEVVEIQLVSGNGTDINRAIRRLPERGGRVLLGAGIFETKEPIVLDRDNVELRGSGKLTIIRLADQAACPVVVIGHTATPVPRIVQHVSIRNMVIDGNRTTQGPECWGGVCDNGGVSFIRNNCLTIRGAADVKVEQIVTKRARSGGVVLEKVCRQIYIDNLEAYDNHFDGLACYETEDSYFSRLHLHSNLSAGISLDIDFNHNVIKSTKLNNNGSQGIFMRDSNNNDFKKIEIIENGAQGIFVAQADKDEDTCCTNNVFSDVLVLNNKSHGLRINDTSCRENLVRNSTFEGNVPVNVSQAKEALISLLNVVGN